MKVYEYKSNANFGEIPKKINSKHQTKLVVVIVRVLKKQIVYQWLKQEITWTLIFYRSSI